MADVYPPYIFGMHDRGGEQLMIDKNRRGWVLVTEALGADPNNNGGSNYTDLANRGLGVIVRLNYGYGSAGTIPYSNQYADFSRRCGNFVQASPGCHAWIIGNEMNLANERPGGPNGQVITPQLYADCFLKCRNEIRRRTGHETDQVVVGAVGPWNTETRYSGNLNGDWVRYLADILNLLGTQADGISLHTYTHGQDPGLVFSDAKMNAPFQNYHWHFRAYRDFIAAIPDALRNRPVYITETDQYNAWRNENTGWVRNAYKEIDTWNRDQTKQPIQSLMLFRWIIGNPNDPQQVGWAIENKPGVQDDFRDALNNEYRVVLPQVQPDYRVEWLEVAVPGRMEPGTQVRFKVQARNEGRRTWANSGTEAVRVGYRWLDAGGQIAGEGRSDLPAPVASGETVTLPAMPVQPPDIPGYYSLELDMVEGVSGWFAEQGSPVHRVDDIQVGARYRAAWPSVAAPAVGTAGETVTFPVTVRNEGAMTWPPDGDHPVNLSYKWLDADRKVVVADGLRTPIGRQVAPLETASLDARVEFPPGSGAHILQMDMVQEFVVWFQWKGSPVCEAQVQVEPAVPDYAAEWLAYTGPGQVVIGQVGEAYLEVKNTGSQPWPASGDGAVRLGYRWFDAQGQEMPVADAQTWPMPGTIEPGDVATFRDLTFQVPLAPGVYRLVWDLIQGSAWLSAQGVAVLERAVQVVAPEYGVTWDVLEPWPAWMMPDAEQRTSLRLHNVGTRTWAASGDHPVHLAYTWFTQGGAPAEPWDTYRILLPRDVPAGSEVDLLDIPFRTPPVLGDYFLRWDLVEEGVTWFFRRGAAPLEVAIEISDEALYPPWTAQASHNPEQVSLAFDGNPDTFWDSKVQQEPGMWLQIDLGEVLVLDRVRVFSPGRGFPVGYKIKLSEDGQDWHLVAEQAKNWTNVNEAFAPCRARFLWLEQIGQPDWPATWMISEVNISAAEPWAAAEASHYTADSHKAWDARLKTYWNTRAVKQKPGMWFKLDMGSPREIERITLVHPSSQQPRGYFIQISDDGQTWQEVGRKDDNWGTADVQFQAAVARYLYVETTNSSPYHPWGIAECVVWRSSPRWLVGRTV